MNLTAADKDIIKMAKSEKFREYLLEYIDEEQEKIKAGIVSSPSEDMSKTKRNDRDIKLFELSMLEEFKWFPDRLLTLIENSEFVDQ